MVGPPVRCWTGIESGGCPRGRGLAPRFPRRSRSRSRDDGFGGDAPGLGQSSPPASLMGACTAGMEGACAGQAGGHARHTKTLMSRCRPIPRHDSRPGARSGLPGARASACRTVDRCPRTQEWSFPACTANRNAGRMAYTRRPLRPCRTAPRAPTLTGPDPPVASEDPRRWHASRPRHRARHGPAQARALAARPRAGMLRSPRRPASSPATPPRRRMPMAADSPLSVQRPASAPRPVSHAERLVQDLPPFPSRAALRALTDRELPSTDGRPLPESMFPAPDHPLHGERPEAVVHHAPARDVRGGGADGLQRGARAERRAGCARARWCRTCWWRSRWGSTSATPTCCGARARRRSSCWRWSRSRRGGATADEKPVEYAGLGVREYFLFDPQGRWLEPRVQGYALGRGRSRRLREGAAWGRAVGGAQPGCWVCGRGRRGREGSFAGATRTRGGTWRTTTRFTTAGTRRPKPGAWRRRGPRRKPPPGGEAEARAEEEAANPARSGDSGRGGGRGTAGGGGGGRGASGAVARTGGRAARRRTIGTDPRHLPPRRIDHPGSGIGPLGSGAPGFTLHHRLQGRLQLVVPPARSA